MSREEAMHHDFDGMTDEEIALLAQQGDADASEYLLNKYKNFVRSKARSYFLVGADHEDIVQEGMIGLFKAFRDFRPDKPPSMPLPKSASLARSSPPSRPRRDKSTSRSIPTCRSTSRFTRRRATER